MAEPGRYSLKELLYWLTVWSVCLGALSAAFREPRGVIFLAAWFIGTTVVNKAFGYRAGFWYAALFGVVLCLLLAASITGMSNPSPPPRYGLLGTFVLLYGIGFGSVLWLVAFGFDKLFRDRKF